MGQGAGPPPPPPPNRRNEVTFSRFSAFTVSTIFTAIPANTNFAKRKRFRAARFPRAREGILGLVLAISVKNNLTINKYLTKGVLL
jgi:hypothetical protein